MKEHLKDYIENGRTPEVRGLRILLEYFYATEIFEHITRNRSTKIISVFGSARTKPDSEEYHLAYRLGGLLYRSGFAVVTGASRGIMQAANQGVADAIAQELLKKKKVASLEAARQNQHYKTLLKSHSVGLSISLPLESHNNPYIGVYATFHYFMVRKFFFGSLSSGFIACEGGWGTRDELYEILTLVQTGKAPVMPIVYLSEDPDHLEKDIRHALRKKYISPMDLDLIHLVKTPEQAAQVMRNFYRNVESLNYERDQGVKIVLKRPVNPSLRKEVERILAKDYPGQLRAEWKGRQLLLYEFAPASYGPLRRAVNLLNR